MKEFRLHQSGLYVAEDGEVFVPQSGPNPAHYTYGSKNKGGYWQVVYKGKPYYVHRLVAETYIPNPENKPCIDHIIPLSIGGTNEASNLRWCTYPENSNNPLTRQKMQGKKRSEETKQKMSKAQKGNHNNPKKPVVGVHKTTGEIVEFESAKDAWLTLNIDRGCICSCCRGKLKSAGGYVWNYA